MVYSHYVIRLELICLSSFADTPKSNRPEANGKKINEYFKVYCNNILWRTFLWSWKFIVTVNLLCFFCAKQK